MRLGSGLVRSQDYRRDILAGPRRRAIPEVIAEPAANVGVDFVENQRTDLVVTGEHRLEGQHGTRQLATAQLLPEERALIAPSKPITHAASLDTNLLSAPAYVNHV